MAVGPDAVLFEWQDYLIVAIVLVLSAGIGFYYALTGGRQKTTNEYLFADRSVHWLAVSCSLLASWVSSLNLLSYPGEVYAFGTIFILGFAAWPIGILISSKFYLPIFHQLNVVSMFEYVELRYGKPVKYVVIWANLFSIILYTGLVIYGPSLALSAVTGMNLWVSVALVTGVSLFYTIIGGMKAVLWTDTMQLVIMIVGIVIVYIVGVLKEGGFAEIYRVNKLSGRLDIFDAKRVFDFDPRARHTIWNLMLNNLTISISAYGLSQASVQRALSLKNKKDIIKTYGLAAGLNLIIGLIACTMGLVIFSHNRYCDPMKSGEIFSRDQYYPLYVMRLFGHMPGMPGFILSAIFSGTLSTISSMISGCATVLMADVVKPLRPRMSDTNATIVTKVLTVVVGIVSVIFVIFAKNFGYTLISVLLTIGGVFGGPIFAVFTMGIFLPFVRVKGAFIGFIIGVAYAGWFGFGNLINKAYVYSYPVTTGGCNVTLNSTVNINPYANISLPVYHEGDYIPTDHYRKGVDALYDISYQWVMCGAVLVTSLIAITVSLVFERKNRVKLDYLLFAPGVVDMFPKSWQDMIDFDTNNEINLSTKSTTDRQSSTSEGDSGESQQDKDSSIGEKGHENKEAYLENEDLEEEHKGL